METNISEISLSPKRKLENIFKVRKVHQALIKQKYTKPNFNDRFKKQLEKRPTQEGSNQNIKPSIILNTNNNSPKIIKKTADYHYHYLIVSSPQYKQLSCKFNKKRQEENHKKKQRQSQIQQKNQQLSKIIAQGQRLRQQRQKLEQKQYQLRRKIEYIRYRRQNLHQQFQQEFNCQQPRQYQDQQNQNNQFSFIPQSLLNQFSINQDSYMSLQHLRDMMLSLRYQNGLDINPDQMTYQQLLQLEQKMGSVSKGLSQQLVKRIDVVQVSQQMNKEELLCSICYQNAITGDKMNKLTCKHMFHIDCVKQWLRNQKICPMCKQEIDLSKLKQLSSKSLQKENKQDNIKTFKNIQNEPIGQNNNDNNEQNEYPNLFNLNLDEELNFFNNLAEGQQLDKISQWDQKQYQSYLNQNSYVINCQYIQQGNRNDQQQKQRM